MELADFLLARYDEREQMAWEVHQRGCCALMEEPESCECGEEESIRADCAAKRRLVRYATRELHDLDCLVNGEWGIYSSSAKDDVLRALAAPFADHPHFDREWRLPHEHTPACRDGDGPRCARCGMRCHDRADCPRTA